MGKLSSISSRFAALSHQGKFISKVYFIGLVVPLILSGVTAYRNTLALGEETSLVSRTNMILDNLSSTLEIVVGAETSQRGFILTKNPEYLKPYTQSVKKIHANLVDLKVLVSDPKQIENIPPLEELINYKLQEMQTILEIKGQQQQIKRIDQDLGRALMDSIRFQVDHMISIEVKLLSEREATYRNSYQRAFKYGTIFALIGLLLLGVTLLHLKGYVRELRIAKQKSEEASLAKSSFLANMSHELRTPLTSIMMYTEIVKEDLEEDPSHAQNVMDLDKVIKSGESLMGLIEDILDLAKVEAGRIDLRYEKVVLKDILDIVILQATALMEKNANNFTVDTQDGIMDLIMDTDPKRVRQILLNLLSNAAKFTKKGEIHLITRVDLSTITFKVTDTGIGMTAEHATHIWHEFEQANDSISRRYGGTGLGLALTKRFTQSLRGTVSMESTFGVGSIFTITLPLGGLNGENPAR